MASFLSNTVMLQQTVNTDQTLSVCMYDDSMIRCAGGFAKSAPEAACQAACVVIHDPRLNTSARVLLQP
jgi:hypothetical protein